jgi:hypothetical protein
VPVHEHAGRVFLPCPDMQRIERRQADAVRALGQGPHPDRGLHEHHRRRGLRRSAAAGRGGETGAKPVPEHRLRGTCRETLRFIGRSPDERDARSCARDRSATGVTALLIGSIGNLGRHDVINLEAVSAAPCRECSPSSSSTAAIHTASSRRSEWRRPRGALVRAARARSPGRRPLRSAAPFPAESARTRVDRRRPVRPHPRS